MYKYIEPNKSKNTLKFGFNLHVEAYENGKHNKLHIKKINQGPTASLLYVTGDKLDAMGDPVQNSSGDVQQITLIVKEEDYPNNLLIGKKRWAYISDYIDGFNTYKFSATHIHTYD